MERPRHPRDAQRRAGVPRRDADAVEPAPGARRLRRATPTGSSARSGGRPASPSTAWAGSPGCARETAPVRRSSPSTTTASRRSRCRAGTGRRASSCTSSHTGRCSREPDLPHHGGTFTRVLLDATEEFLGVDRADALAAAYSAERVRVGRPPRPGPDGRLRYGWDERLRLGRGRALHVAWLGPAGPDRAVGTFLGFERSGATLRLDIDDTLHRIPTTFGLVCRRSPVALRHAGGKSSSRSSRPSSRTSGSRSRSSSRSR